MSAVENESLSNKESYWPRPLLMLFIDRHGVAHSRSRHDSFGLLAYLPVLRVMQFLHKRSLSFGSL